MGLLEKIDAFRVEMASLAGKLERETTELLGKVARLEQTLAERGRQIATLQDRLADAQAVERDQREAAELLILLEGARTRIRELEAAATAHPAALADRDAQIATLTAEVARLTRQLAPLEAIRAALGVGAGEALTPAFSQGERETNPAQALTPALSQGERETAGSGCAVPWCEGERLAKGFCSKHYTRLKVQGDAYLAKLRKGNAMVLCREVGPEQFEPVE